MEHPKLPEKTFVPNDHVREEDKHQSDAKMVHVLVTHMSPQCVCVRPCVYVWDIFLYILGISGEWRCTDINILEVSRTLAYLLYYWYVSQMKSSLVASRFCVMNRSINHFDPDSLYSMWREQFFSVTEPPFQSYFRKLPSEPAALSLCSCPALAVSSSKGKSGADIWVTGWVRWTQQGSCQAHWRLQCSSFVFCQMEGS